MRPYEPYIPQTSGELVDQLGSMMLGAPKFKHFAFPTNIDTEFKALNGGLEVIRKRLGEERYQTMRATSDRMRVLFESDPEDATGACNEGRDLIDQMQQMLMRPKRN